jgi:hypothetical protein
MYRVSERISTRKNILYFLNWHKHGNFNERCRNFPSFDVPQYISTCVPLVARQMSRRHSTCRQLFCSITGVTVSHAAVILRRSLSISCAFFWNYRSFMYVHRRKSEGVKSGDLEGHLPENCWWRKAFTGLAYARRDLREKNFLHLSVKLPCF